MRLDEMAARKVIEMSQVKRALKTAELVKKLV